MNFRQRQLTGIRSIPVFILLASILLGINTKQVIASELTIQNVQLNQPTLTPGEEVKLSFYMNKEAKVTVHIYTPDYDLIQTLIDNETRPAGVNTFFWNGRDNTEQMVPNEAYLFGITAVAPDGTQAVYDPTKNSGGEIADVQIHNIRNENGSIRVTYTLVQPSRISLRAGIHKGPLLKTLLNWQPMPAGAHEHIWDGMDETGRIPVMEQPGGHVFIEGVTLPENTVIVQESAENYVSYQKNLQASDQGVINFQSTKRAIMQRIDENISAQSLVKRSMNVPPMFTVYLGDDTTVGLAEKPVQTVSGDIELLVVVDPESMHLFNETRHEIIIFIDNQRFDEEEHAHTPYKYPLDTRRISDGKHYITINQASLTGQVGSYSFMLNVKNQ
jgi:hypothetical protein